MRHIKIISIIMLICIFLIGCSNNSSEFDYDLTQMNLELKCATFERMHQDYQNTIGKTIKIDGYYEVVDIEGTKYHLVTFMDPTGCCPYSMEWVPNTDELPKQGTNITIVGTFSTYTEEGSNNIYSHLIDTSFTLTN